MTVTIGPKEPAMPCQNEGCDARAWIAGSVGDLIIWDPFCLRCKIENQQSITSRRIIRRDKPSGADQVQEKSPTP